MLLDELIYTRLSTKAQNVYPLAAPLTYRTPAVVYNVLTEVPVRDISDDEHTKAFATVQVDVYDPDFLTGMQLARAIRRDFLAWEDVRVEVLTCSDIKRSVDNTSQVELYRAMVFFTLYVSDED